MKPWAEKDDWFENYARRIMVLKPPGTIITNDLPEVCRAVKEAFTRVYRAVAFDISLFCHSPKSFTISKFCNCCLESECSVIF